MISTFLEFVLNMSERIKVIFDTDLGCDDAWALITLLKCEEKFSIELQAITIVPGNTSAVHASQNALFILKTLNRMDVKVYAGAKDSLISKKNYKSNFHGEDGLQDIFRSNQKPSLDLLQKEHAVEAIKDLIEKNPHEIVIFAVGPLTNIALLLKMYPEISSKIKALHVMGGNFMGVGNVTKQAEFNFWFDPEAAHIVLSEVKCPLYILPWETCLKASLAMPHKEWRFGVLNKIPSEIISLMDVIEENVHYRHNFIPCDALLIACYCFPQMIETLTHYSVTVELNGTHTRGQMIIDRCFDEEKNAFVIESVDVELFKKILFWVCGHDIKDV